MRPVRTGKLQSAINVTPLVDVVLVLLIIFMVILPQLNPGPAMQLPTTERPPEQADDGRQILVAIERDGRIWVDDDAMRADEFSESMRRAAVQRGDWQVVIKGDARLSFGEVRQAMLAVDAAGFKDVGLVAQRRDEER